MKIIQKHSQNGILQTLKAQSLRSVRCHCDFGNGRRSWSMNNTVFNFYLQMSWKQLWKKKTELFSWAVLNCSHCGHSAMATIAWKIQFVAAKRLHLIYKLPKAGPILWISSNWICWDWRCELRSIYYGKMNRNGRSSRISWTKTRPHNTHK